MGTFREVMNAIKTQNQSAYKKALKGKEWPPAQVDKIWVASCHTLKTAFVSTAYALGPISQHAIGQGLVAFIKERKNPLFLKYLEELEDINWHDKEHRTLLSHAVEQRNKTVIDALTARQPDPTIVDTQGLPPLYYAMRATQTKLVKELLVHPLDLKNDQVAKMLIDVAPNKATQLKLIHSHLTQRTSSMTRAQFVEKWGEPEPTHEEIPWPEVRETGERFMKGTFYNVGYLTSQQDDAYIDALKWDAVDAAKTFANQLATILHTHQCHGILNSEGSIEFKPFFIPSLGRTPNTEDLDAKMSKKSIKTGSGSYAQKIEVIEQYGGGFDRSQILFDLRTETITQQQADGYNMMMELTRKHLTEINEYRLYPDLVEFPLIIGGLDHYHSFVGVIGTAVWT